MTVDTCPAVEQSVFPGVTNGHSPLATGALRVALLELSKQPRKLPAEAQCDMAGVHAQITQYADLTTVR